MELRETVKGRLLEAREDGVADYMTDDGAIVRTQDVTEIVRQNHFLQGEDRFRGFRKAPDFRMCARIPVAVVDIAYARGLDILNNKEHLRLFLNDPENRAFRTTLERV